MNIEKEMLPKHLAIIMDGNGRWAKQQGKQRIFGHEKGAKTVREIIQEVSQLGIPYLTLYAFSTENWKRPVRSGGTDALIITLFEQGGGYYAAK